MTARHAVQVTLLALLLPTAARGQPWVNDNPGAGGAFTSIGAGPTGTIVCGSDLSGAYRSLDRGQTWDIIGATRGLKETHVRAVAFDPIDPGILYLGSENGIYRSVDGGDSFQETFTPGYISAIAPAPGNPAVVYAGWHSSFSSANGAVYRSDDRGVTWRPVSFNLPTGLRILKLLVDPGDPQILYLLSGTDLFVPAAPAQLFRSRDGGATWTRIGSSLGNVWDVAMDPITRGTLYATMFQGTPGVNWSGAVYKSVDGGSTWLLKAPHTGCVVVTSHPPQVVRVIDVDRGSSDPEAPEAGVWESADAGTSWSKKSTPSAWDPGWQILTCFAYENTSYGVSPTIGLDLSDPQVIFWVTKQFAYASFDGGATFQNLFTNPIAPGAWHSRGIENVTVAALAISAADPQRIFTGYHDIGLWRSVDGGASWQECNSGYFTGNWKWCGGNTTTVVADPSRPDRIWAAMGVTADTSTLVRSALGGTATSWIGVSGLPTGFLKGLSLDPNSSSTQRTMYVTANGDVYRSLDDGATWSLSFACGGCRATAVDRLDGNLVYAGGEAGLWRSTTGGAPGSWAGIGPPDFLGSSPTPVRNEQWTGVHSIAPDPQQTGTVYVAAYGAGKGIYRGTGQGSSWTKLRDGTYTRGVAVDPTNSSVIYATSSKALKAGGPAAGSEGVLRSSDGGLTWSTISDGLAWPFAAQVVLDPANPNHVVVGSPGTGFFSRTLSGTPPPELTPTAALTLTQAASPALTVNADASGSTDADLTPIARYHFDFGDGSPIVTTTAPTATVPHTYAAAGTCTVTLTVTDTGFNTSAPITRTLAVTPPDFPPVSSLSLTQPATPPLTVSADASASTDTDLTPIASYHFDFGDGSPVVNTIAPTATAQHAYTAAGSHTVSLTVTDTGSNTSTPVTAGITVQPELAPVAGLAVTQLASPALTVSADASGSTDTDLTPIASYDFDFGDGTPVVHTTAPTATAQHTYAAAGSRTVSVIVTDTGGNPSAPVSRTLSVAPPDSPPTASLWVAQLASPPLTVNANGAGSTDTDATPIATYHFDFGDGTPVVNTTAPTATAQHTYASAGPRTVTLTATDSGNLTSAPVTASITVAPPDVPPVASLAVAQLASPPLTVSANASGSTDTDTTPIATYHFDFGDGTPVVTTTAPTATAQHTYASAGSRTVTLTVTDTGNHTSTPATATLNVTTPTIVEKRTIASTDDAEEFADGTMYLNSSDLELIHDASDQTVGMRWTALAIPPGVTITAAYIQFAAKESQSEATTITFRGQAADSPPTFGTGAHDITNRARTVAGMTWSPVAWNAGEAGANQRTPDLSAVIQEVVSRPGWASGNALIVIVNGTGHRTAWAWDGNAAAAPLLHVEYVTQAPGAGSARGTRN